jgi:predicted kinase
MDPDSNTGQLIHHPVETAKDFAHARKASVADATAHIARAFAEAVRAFRAALDEPLPAQSSSQDERHGQT